jgi:hypothetical protein
MGRRWMHFLGVVVVLGVCTTSWSQQKKATNPNPADGAAAVAMPLLQWTAGSTALFHDVYLGTTSPLGPASLVGSRQFVPMYYHVPGFEPGVRYYWRVDEIDRDGVTVYTGDVWTFLTQALTAYNPDPADGAMTVSPSAILKWSAGTGAIQHHVYFSDNRDAVSKGTADADKGVLALADTQYAPKGLQGAVTYYWRVDEVIGGGVRAGAVWTFTTWTPIDDFESYTDTEGRRVYETWIDGWTNNTGSTVGYAMAPFAEQKIVHSGLQSMPVDFNNLVAPYYSEVKREFSPAQDWTAGGSDSLVLYVQGKSVDFVIPSVSPAPVIDGKVDTVWATATVLPLKTKIDGTDPTGPADCSGQFRALYDATCLYVLVDINDSSLRNDSTSAYLDDSAEIYIDGDNTKKGPGLTGNARQYTFGWNATDIQGTNTNLTGVEFAQTTTATGWRLEVKMPWTALIGAGAPVGKLIGVDCFYNDDDDGLETRERQLAWHSTLANDWQTPASWGTARIAPPSTAKVADQLYVALQDSANHVGVITHSDPKVVETPKWVEWKIPLSDFTAAGVNVAKVKTMYLGVGDRAKPVAGGTSLIYIDDISLTKPAPAAK